MSQPQFHIQPGAVIDAVQAPVTELPWTWIVIIVFVVIAAVLIISWTTQRSIKAMASTARQMVNEARSSSSEGRRTISGLSALGRAELDWEAGAFRLGLRHRFTGGESGLDSAMMSADRLAQQLYGLGVSDADILQSEPTIGADGVGVVDMSVSLLTDAEARSVRVLEAGIACGFSEVREDGREEISYEDASELAGRSAIEDAMANTSILLDHLKIAREGLKVISARIHSEAGNGRIIRVAEIVWDGDR